MSAFEWGNRTSHDLVTALNQTRAKTRDAMRDVGDASSEAWRLVHDMLELAGVEYGQANVGANKMVKCASEIQDALKVIDARLKEAADVVRLADGLLEESEARRKAQRAKLGA